MRLKRIITLMVCILAISGCNESSFKTKYTAEEAAVIAARLEREASDPLYQEAMQYYMSGDYGEAQKRFSPLAEAGNSMAALYIWRCNPIKEETSRLRKTQEKIVYMTWPRKSPPTGYEYTSVDTNPFLMQAAERDNPYAMNFLGGEWLARARGYWHVRAHEANDGDAWYCLGLKIYSLMEDESWYEMREHFFKGTLAGSEAATYTFIYNKEILGNIRTEKGFEGFRNKYPDWEAQYFAALKKLADEGRPYAQYHYSKLTDDPSYLILATDQKLYKAWIDLTDYYYFGGNRPCRTEKTATQAAFMENVRLIYEFGRILEYDNPRNSLEYDAKTPAECMNTVNKPEFIISREEYGLIIESSRKWLRNNRFIIFIHPLGDLR